MEGSDTSSEDEEQRAMLRDAIGDNEISQYSYTQQQKIKEKKIAPTALPSLRPDKEKNTEIEEHGYAELTKGAKDFVAKKLSEYLESELDTSEICISANAQREIPEEGIRLFKNSTDLVMSIDIEEPKPQPRRRRVSSSEDSSSEDERLHEAAVSHAFIVKQSQKVLPSLKTEADIVIKMTDDQRDQMNVKSVEKKKKKKKLKKEGIT